MPFKIRDLVVTVLPHRAGDDCGACTTDTRCNRCTNQYSDCPGGCSNGRSDYSEKCPTREIDPRILVYLRERLREAIAHADSTRAAETLMPQTRSEIVALETKLKGALTELRRMKVVPAPAPRPGTFKVRDLLVSILPRECSGCDGGISRCPGGQSTEHDDPDRVVLDPAEARALLAHALAESDGANAVPVATIRTTADKLAVETRIREALASLAQRKVRSRPRPARKRPKASRGT